MTDQTHTPGRDCALCPRLTVFRCDNREKFPDMFNAPVPAFGSENPSLLIVGLAPGLRGANFTGRPFTNDYAGDLLYPTLIKYGFASGEYGAHANDGLQMIDARITNAVKCVPPENKPTTEEIKTCQRFLTQEISGFSRLQIILTLGLIAHNSVLRALGEKISAHKFGHGHQHVVGGFTMINSYHCSRYNVNTGRLTTEMFEDVVQNCRTMIDSVKAA